MREYYNPKLRTYIAKNEETLEKEIEQGTLIFMRDGKESVAYIDVSDAQRVPILPVWEELD